VSAAASLEPGRLLHAAEFHAALAKINQLEMRMSRLRELQLSSYILIFDRGTWRWLYSHARGRYQRQLCMGQRSWSGWEYMGRTIDVRSKKTGKSSRLSQQASKIDSANSLLRRAGYMTGSAGAISEPAPVHHITADVHASSQKKIVSTLLVGIAHEEWAKACAGPWNSITHAKEALHRDPSEAGLDLSRAHCRAAWSAGLFDRECWLAPPLEWVVEVELRRYVRKPRPRKPSDPVKKTSIVDDALEVTLTLTSLTSGDIMTFDDS